MRDQTFKPSSLQAFKPYKALIALFAAALALCFCAACSDDTSGNDTIPTAAIGEYNATEYLATQINTALSSDTSETSIMTLEDNTQTSEDEDEGFFSSDDISLTINSDNTVSVSVVVSYLGTNPITIPGTCVYSSSGSSFTFTLNYNSATATGFTDDDLSTLRYLMSQLGPSILSSFNPAYYSNGALYDSSTISDTNKIFEKATTQGD